jgi:hypothetical protein
MPLNPGQSDSPRSVQQKCRQSVLKNEKNPGMGSFLILASNLLYKIHWIKAVNFIINLMMLYIAESFFDFFPPAYPAYAREEGNSGPSANRSSDNQ